MNIQHPTFNTEHPIKADEAQIGAMLDVGCFPN